MELALIIGKQIMQRRNELNLSQDELSLKSGVAKMTISKMERGLTIPKADTLLKLSRAMDTDINYFFEGLSIYSPKNSNDKLLISIFKNLKPSKQIQLIEFAKYLNQIN